MTPKKLKGILLGLRDRMASQLQASQGNLASESGRFRARAPIDQAESASDEQELNMLASSLSASSETLGEINEALDRLNAGHYNECEECGKEIGERRLEVKPWAKLCVNCKKKHESENR